MPSHTLTPAKRITRGVCLADPLWPLLGDAERRVVIAWETIAVRLMGATDKTRELQRIRRDFAGILRGLSKGTIYRKVAALSELGAEGVLGTAALRRLGQKDGSRLPKAFILYWRQLCADNQRMKALNVWQMLMRNLKGGVIIPGYDMDWRGIWLSEHPGRILPNTEECTVYAVDHRRNAHPRGWSYRNLKDLAPEEDVWKAVAQGVAAGRAYLLSVPHTRVGLGPMEVITMDDVWHDVEVLFLQGRDLPTHERPVEVGVLDVLTGCHVAWQVWPVRRRADGTREMVDATVQRFIQAEIFCGIGVSPKGLTELLEHGTAGMGDKEVKRINGILSRYLPPPEGREGWLSVSRSTTTVEPIAKGLFCERACGNPRHKAMLESSWNLLHNALASLPGAIGRRGAHLTEPVGRKPLKGPRRGLVEPVDAQDGPLLARLHGGDPPLGALVGVTPGQLRHIGMAHIDGDALGRQRFGDALGGRPVPYLQDLVHPPIVAPGGAIAIDAVRGDHVPGGVGRQQFIATHHALFHGADYRATPSLL